MRLNPKSLTPSLTLFTIPKPFRDHNTEIHQCNAIQSWQQLEPPPEIFLCGNDPGVAETAQKLGVRHLPHIQCNGQGTPLLHDAFAQVQDVAQNSILAYLNSDIMLMPDFGRHVQTVAQQHGAFLMLGRRWNLEVEAAIDFERSDWDTLLRARLQKYGIFSGIGALDYFVFPKLLFTKLPPFAVGRAGWDNWMVGEALKQGYSVVNASQVVTAIHQNHDYSHLPGQRLEAFHGLEAKQNRALLNSHFAGNTADATCYLHPLDVAAGNDHPKISIITACPEQVPLPITDIEIELIAAEQPAKLVSAWNRSLAKARGEFVLFLDNESRLLPNALGHWLERIETRSGSLEMCFAGWDVSIPSEEPDCKEWSSVEPWHQLNRLLAGREGLHGLHIWSLPTIWPLVHPSSVLFRRDWLERFGPLDETLQPWGAVLDLVLRLSSRGAAAVFLEASVLRYFDASLQGSAAGGKFQQRITEDSQRILQNFFQQAHLPPWMHPLQSQAEKTVQGWLQRLANGSTLVTHD